MSIPKDKYDAEAAFKALYGTDPPKSIQQLKKAKSVSQPPASAPSSMAGGTKRQTPQQGAPVEKSGEERKIHRAYYIFADQDTAIGLRCCKERDMDRSAVVRAALEAYLAKELREVRAPGSIWRKI